MQNKAIPKEIHSDTFSVEAVLGLNQPYDGMDNIKVIGHCHLSHRVYAFSQMKAIGFDVAIAMPEKRGFWWGAIVWIPDHPDPTTAVVKNGNEEVVGVIRGILPLRECDCRVGPKENT